MNKEKFVGILSGAGKLYGKEIDKETMEMWLSEEFKQAMNEHIKTSRYFPTVADIRERIANKKVENMPKAEDEWNKVIDLVHKYGSYQMDKALGEMSDYTRYIVSHIGYIRICNADIEEQTWNKKSFVAEYNELRNANIELLQLGATNYVPRLLQTEVID